MIHQGQRLSLGLEARYHALRVHSGLDDLECDAPADRLLLFRYENDAATSFADLLQQLVSTHTLARLFPGSGFCPLFTYGRCWRLFQERSDSVIRLEQSLYLVTKVPVVSAGPIQKGDALRGCKLNRFRKELNVASRVHAS
jgi:hypothetical protein